MRILESSIYIKDLKKAASAADLSFLNGKKLLITGGTGLIGSAVVDLILMNNEVNSAGTVIYVASRDEVKVTERFGGSEYVKWLYYDALEPISFDVPVDYIIHCAGNASPELYVNKAVETMLMNFEGINNLLSYAKEHEVSGVLYLSSSEVYGIKETSKPYKETDYGFVDLLKVRSSYSNSKRAAETLCCSYAEEYGVRTMIARPGHIFGPGASVKDRRVSSFFPYEVARGKSLILTSSGSQIRSNMYSIDCAVALLTILGKGNSGEAYNVCGKETTSIREMAAIVTKAAGTSLSYQEPTEEEKAQDNPMNNSSLVGEKLFALGFEPCFTTEEGLAHTVQILREAIG